MVRIHLFVEKARCVCSLTDEVDTSANHAKSIQSSAHKNALLVLAQASVVLVVKAAFAIPYALSLEIAARIMMNCVC